MYKLSEIKELIKLVDQSSIQELEIENDGTRICIRKPNKTETVFMNNAHPSLQNTHSYQPISPAPLHIEESTTPSAPPKNDTSNLYRIVSPMVGTYYHAASPDSPPFVKKGDKITEKTVVCIVEAMKLMNEILAETKGEIVEILVENGHLVEYGQPLFLVRTL